MLSQRYQVHPWQGCIRPENKSPKVKINNVDYYVEMVFGTAKWFEECACLALFEYDEIDERDLTPQEPDPDYLTYHEPPESSLPLQWLLI